MSSVYYFGACIVFTSYAKYKISRFGLKPIWSFRQEFWKIHVKIVSITNDACMSSFAVFCRSLGE